MSWSSLVLQTELTALSALELILRADATAIAMISAMIIMETAVWSAISVQSKKAIARVRVDTCICYMEQR